MNNTEQQRIFIQAMIKSLRRVVRFTEGIKRQDFFANEIVVFATMKAIQDAYSAAIELSRVSHKKRVKLDWEALRITRNLLAHSIGDDIDLEFLWQEASVTAKKILRVLEDHLQN